MSLRLTCEAQDDLKSLDVGVCRESLNDVVERWLGWLDVPDSVRHVAVLRGAGLGVRATSLALGLSRKSVRAYWARARSELLHEGRALSTDSRHRAALGLLGLGESLEVAAHALRVDVSEAPRELKRALLEALRKRDPIELQIKRCWAEQTRVGPL